MKAIRAIALAALLATTTAACQQTPEEASSSAAETGSLWDQGNLLAWSVGPYDAQERGPEERAAMLQALGFNRYAYYWVPPYIPSFETEIEAMKAHDIAIQGWWYASGADDPLLDQILALFAKQEVQPHLWTVPPFPDFGELAAQSNGALPADFATLPQEERISYYPVISRLILEQEQRNWPKTPEEHRARVEQEAKRIAAIAAKAKPYGITVDLYCHVLWPGMPENAADVVEYLQSQGVDNVGIVYNFNHARSELRDDTAHFAETWARMQPYVSTVILAGTHMEDGTALLPGDGDSELAMMRVIEDSGWRGPVGVSAESGGDAEATLTKAVAGLETLAQELHEEE